jgi:hypothetical protein
MQRQEQPITFRSFSGPPGTKESIKIQGGFVQFNIQERLLLLTRLSGAVGNVATLRVVRDLQRELGFTEKEHKQLNFKTENNRTSWDPSNIPLKEVAIGPAALNAIFGPLQELAQNNGLPMEFLDIYEKLEKAKEELSAPKLAAV